MAFYNRGKHLFADPTAVTAESPFLLASDVIKVALMLVAYSQDIDAHAQFDDISASEITATNYTSRGSALASKAITQNNTNDRAEFDAADLVFSSIGNGANATTDEIVLLREPDSGASNANSDLIASMAIASTTTNGGDITLQWNSAGILHFT